MIYIVNKRISERINKVHKNNVEIPEVESLDYGIVIDVTFNNVNCFYRDRVVKLTLDNSIKKPCNKVLFAGDRVVIENNKVVGIIKRKNVLRRDKSDSTRLKGISLDKVIAVNIDIAVIVVSSTMPPLHPKLIDRYIILLENYKIPYVIVVNKCELLTEKEKELLDLYRRLGIKVLLTSVVEHKGIIDLLKLLDKKQAIFLGHSGVGKSSLTKEIITNDAIRIGKLRDKNGKGCHTTTTSTYYKWNDESGIIDTPGIRSLDITSFPKKDIQNYFVEFDKYRDKCKYSDCLHYNEKDEDCEIKKQVQKGTINKERYESYYKIISELKEK